MTAVFSLFLLLSLSGALVAAGASISAKARPTLIPNCGSTWYLDYRPSGWSAGCTGGSLNLTKLHWSKFGRSRAQASGRAELREPCGDNPCYLAGLYKAKAKLAASRPRRCSAGALARSLYFSRVEVKVLYRAGNPFGRSPGWKRNVFKIKAYDGVCYHTPPT